MFYFNFVYIILNNQVGVNKNKVQTDGLHPVMCFKALRNITF